MIVRSMKHALFALIALLCILALNARADDRIRVLMLESPYDPLPSGDIRTIDQLSGKVFINGQFYSGSLEIMKARNGLYIINALPFEEYIEGVVASEISSDWEVEAMKAQAVISRSYASYFRDLNKGNYYHVTSSVLHQIYKGKNSDPVISRAVQATAGEKLTFNDMPVKAFFHADCDGKTELPEEIWQESQPYLQSVECFESNSPYNYWQRKYSLTSLSDSLGRGRVKDMGISSYTATGRVRTLEVTFEDSSSALFRAELKATEMRKLLGYKDLPSSQFSLTREGDYIIFSGRGYGHAVGLSQWGALEMAKQGKTYQEILAHYYPGTTIQKDNGPVSQKLALTQ